MDKSPFLQRVHALKVSRHNSNSIFQVELFLKLLAKPEPQTPIKQAGLETVEISSFL